MASRPSSDAGGWLSQDIVRPFVSVPIDVRPAPAPVAPVPDERGVDPRHGHLGRQIKVQREVSASAETQAYHRFEVKGLGK
jgi:hypothetical protein